MSMNNQTYIFCTDKKLRINSWCHEIARLTGASSSAVLNKKYYEVLPRIWRENKDLISMTFQNNKALILKGYSFNCLHGQMKADLRISPLKGANGRVDKVKVTIHPFQPCPMIKKLEDSQRFLHIGKTASNFAHRIRNPLNAIKGAVVYLREKYHKDPTLGEFTKIMVDEIARLDTFISKFLSSSLSETELSEVNVNSLLRKIEIVTSLQAYANKIKSVYRYGNVPLIRIDPFQLEQAIMNVINNAIEAMPSGGNLAVRTRTERLSHMKYAVIEISDTGPGIDRHKIHNLSIPTEGKGRGFGLVFTREVLQSYNGNLEIKTKKGSGTTIKMFLPLK